MNYVATYEVNVATNFSRFKCIPFCSFEDDDKKFVRGGCVANLKHSELGGMLASDDKDFTDDGLSEVFLWKYKGKEGDTENFNTQSMFELELSQDYMRGQIGRTSEDLEYNHKFRLRHLNTGRLVTVQEITYNGQKITTLGLAPHLNLEANPNPGKGQDNYRISDKADKIRDLEENTLFTFLSTNVDNDSRIKNFSCVKIQHVKSQLYLSMKKKALFNVKPKVLDHEEVLQEQLL